MADLSDVSEALVAIISQAIYPSGTAQASALGAQVKVFAGWPLPAQLDADLTATPAMNNVSIWARDEERNTSRYGRDWQVSTLADPTITASMSGQTVTFGGTGAASQNVAVLANGASFVYAVQATDTPTSIATALAALMAPTIPGTSSSGPVLTLAAGARLQAARIGVVGTLARELGRQERRWQLSVWAADPATRDRLAALVNDTLRPLTFVTLPDGYAGWIRYQGAHQIDAQQKERIYRRDIFYTVEYPTTQVVPATQVVTEQINLTAQDSTAAQISVATVNL